MLSKNCAFISPFFVLAFLIALTNQSNSLRIPFRKEMLYEQTSFSTRMNNIISTDIQLGTPPQKLRVNLEFYSTALWVSEYDNSNRTQIFNTSLSTTFKKTQKKKYYNFQNSRELLARQSLDSFKFPDAPQLEISSFHFFSTVTMTDVPLNSGILGLDLNNIMFSKIAFSGLCDQLKKNNLVEKNSFIIHYINDTDGELIFNETDFISDISKNYKAETNPIKNWGWNIQTKFVVYGKDEMKIPEAIMKFKLELGVVIGTKSYFMYITDHFFNKYYKEDCRFVEIEGTKYSSFTCAREVVDSEFFRRFPRLQFVLNSARIELEPEELFFEIQGSNSFGFSVYFTGLDTTYPVEEWTLGEIVFKKTILRFNSEDKTITVFYKPEFWKFLKRNLMKNIMIAVSIFIGSILCYYFLYKKTLIWSKKVEKSKVKGLLSKYELEGVEMFKI